MDNLLAFPPGETFYKLYVALLLTICNPLRNGNHNNLYLVLGDSSADRIVTLTDFNRCSWVIDLSTTRDPSTVLDTYFNEKGAYDVNAQLKNPDITEYLQPVKKGASSIYYAFPYFVVARATCDSGNYDDSYYRIIMHGTYPTIALSYFPETQSGTVRQDWLVTSPGALINVKPDANYVKVPKNPSHPECYLDMCYPAFVIPLVYLNTPIFEVKVEAMDVFSSARVRIHVTPYYSRNLVGAEIELGKRIPQALEFFPEERINSTANPELISPELEEDLVDKDHFPLDKEDFFSPQYTYGSSPAIFFSGFYQPNLLIMADPDLSNIRPLVWERNPLLSDGNPDENSTIFDHALSCRWLDKKYFNDSSLDIPIYSSAEGEFPNDLGTMYRRRYAPQKYQQKDVPNAIFGVISLQDRLLLVTYSGLAVFYGQQNHTVSVDMALKAPISEKIRKCFKFVRSAKLASQGSDLIVAATYHYNEEQNFKNEQGKIIQKKREINQEIWMGRLVAPGKPLEWNRPGETDNLDIVSEKKRVTQVQQICRLAMSQQFLEADEHKILDYNFDGSNCSIIDGTAAVGQTDTIQVLIQMRMIHKPTLAYFNDAEARRELRLVEDDIWLTFYIVAQHTPLTYYSTSIWEITTIVPRRPCVKSHRQNIKTIESFNSNYFSFYKPSKNSSKRKEEMRDSFRQNCHYANRNMAYRDLYIDRMTYTRQNNLHLFMYGNKLIHSSTGGLAFAFYHGFPTRQENDELRKMERQYLAEDDYETRNKIYLDLKKIVRGYRLKVITFDTGGHFAFLTSMRHLYLGTTGSVQLIRLRPSKGYSMIRTALGITPGLHDARPFSVLFDSQNQLFELVATVRSDKKIANIVKRPVPWDLIVANDKFITKLATLVKKQASFSPPQTTTTSTTETLETSTSDSTTTTSTTTTTTTASSGGRRKRETDPQEKPTNIFRDGIRSLTTHCPFGDPKFYQNYSATLSRLEAFLLEPPMQHSSLGLPLVPSSLMGYQASTYSLMHYMFLHPNRNTYSRLTTDKFQEWAQEKGEESQIGLFRFFSDDPKKYGIVVKTSSFKHLTADTKIARTIPDRFFLDYNQPALITLKFSIATYGSLETTDFHHQKLEEIQLTVDNGNGSLLEVETDRLIDAKHSSVQFQVILRLKQGSGNLEQTLPGENHAVIPVSFHLVGAFGKCFKSDTGSFVGDLVSTAVYAGCLPQTLLQFNWNDTIRSLRFRDPSNWPGNKSSDCYNDEAACFYAKLPLILHFEIYDWVKQRYRPFTGKYKLRVIAGGYDKDHLTYYTPEEQEAYNMPGKSDVSLIWSEWDIVTNSKVKTKQTVGIDESDTDEVILQSGTSAIKWVCHVLSPCARVWPTWTSQTIYYFKLRVSNRDVDNTTLCLHERDMVILLYGFTPAPELQLLFSIIFCIIILLILFTMYACCRNNRKMWRANKVKAYGWMEVIIDTFPRGKKGQEGDAELSQQMRRDAILLSLQGHLKVPMMTEPDKGSLSARSSLGIVAGDQVIRRRRVPSDYRQLEAQGRRGRSPARDDGTRSRSSSTDQSSDQKDALPAINPRHAPATWTDMIYDQIITKRLQAIIERNEERKENILKVVDRTDSKRQNDNDDIT